MVNPAALTAIAVVEHHLAVEVDLDETGSGDFVEQEPVRIDQEVRCRSRHPGREVREDHVVPAVVRDEAICCGEILAHRPLVRGYLAANVERRRYRCRFGHVRFPRNVEPTIAESDPSAARQYDCVPEGRSRWRRSARDRPDPRCEDACRRLAIYDVLVRHSRGVDRGDAAVLSPLTGPTPRWRMARSMVRLTSSRAAAVDDAGDPVDASRDRQRGDRQRRRRRVRRNVCGGASLASPNRGRPRDDHLGRYLIECSGAPTCGNSPPSRVDGLESARTASASGKARRSTDLRAARGTQRSDLHASRRRTRGRTSWSDRLRFRRCCWPDCPPCRRRPRWC